MRPELWALAAAALWAVGSFFGKRGMSTAGLAPEQGLVVRLAVSTTVLILLAAPKLPALARALGTADGRRGIGQIALWEGLAAGALGMLAFYIALKRGELSRVVPLAFTTPLWGFLLGVAVAGEAMTPTKVGGVVAILVGIVLLNL